jgi:hypothetical protein
MGKAGSILLVALLAGCSQAMYQISDEHMEQLRLRIQEELGVNFTVEVIDEMWVVASNAEDHQIQRAAQTLKDYTQALTRTYFERRPERPVKVYLFRDKESYQSYCDKEYENPPRTPFGFYMPGDRKIVVNLNTGQGTLAHELVHPLMEADFPRAPAWFNEGFASLFEQSRYVPGKRIEGLVNWRIRSLKRALSRPNPPTLAEMLALNRDDFYGSNSGVNYAIARFLCLYLQEKDLLVRFYREFRSGARDDPSGAALLQQVTGKTLSDLEAEWRQWVRELPEE